MWRCRYAKVYPKRDRQETVTTTAAAGAAPGSSQFTSAAPGPAQFTSAVTDGGHPAVVVGMETTAASMPQALPPPQTTTTNVTLSMLQRLAQMHDVEMPCLPGSMVHT